jgi:hypothetical protein
VTSGTGAGAGLVHLICGGFINCRYTGSGLIGHGLGPLTSSETNGSVTLSEQEVAKESGTFCPSTGKLDITTTPLEATNIVLPAMDCVEINTGESAKFLSKNGTTCENEDATTQQKDPNVPARAHIYRLVG